MTRPIKAEDIPESFERFKRVLKGLVSVPRREIQDKLDARRSEKKKHKKK